MAAEKSEVWLPRKTFTSSIQRAITRPDRSTKRWRKVGGEIRIDERPHSTPTLLVCGVQQAYSKKSNLVQFMVYFVQLTLVVLLSDVEFILLAGVSRCIALQALCSSSFNNSDMMSPSCRRQRDVSQLQKTERRLPVAEDRETSPSCRRHRDVSQLQ